MEGASKTITATQCAVAREHLGWSQKRLASEAQIDQGTIAQFEAGRRTPMPANMKSIIKALEDGGAVWIPGLEGEYAATASRKWEMPEPRPRKRGEAAGNGLPVKDEALASYWRDHPDLWSSLSEDGRQAIEDRVYGKAAAEEVEETAEGEQECSENQCSQSST